MNNTSARRGTMSSIWSRSYRISHGMTSNHAEQPGWLYYLIKRVFDIGVAATIVLVTLPLYPLIALAIKLDSRGPIFFSQTRVGRNGRLFTLYKFRTMSSSTPAYAVSPDNDETDSRVTRVGRFLRKSKLDELPQFANVLTGDMSIIGPRPEMPFIVQQYTARQRFRLKVRPGISGLWQISPVRNRPIHENLQYDLVYIKSQSLWLDLAIIWKTAILVAKNLKPAGWKIPVHAVTTPQRIIIRTLPIATRPGATGVYQQQQAKQLNTNQKEYSNTQENEMVTSDA